MHQVTLALNLVKRMPEEKGVLCDKRIPFYISLQMPSPLKLGSLWQAEQMSQMSTACLDVCDRVSDRSLQREEHGCGKAERSHRLDDP